VELILALMMQLMQETLKKQAIGCEIILGGHIAMNCLMEL